MHLMDKTPDSDIQNLILKYDKKECGKPEHTFNNFTRKIEKNKFCFVSTFVWSAGFEML